MYYINTITFGTFAGKNMFANDAEKNSLRLMQRTHQRFPRNFHPIRIAGYPSIRKNYLRQCVCGN
jgi:hypothetical protein